ncbi:MAG: IS200/IS605 family transposase [Planctomycetota bacterium]
MSTYHQILYHIVFATKYRRAVLVKPHRAELFRYMAGALKNAKSHVYQVNGIEDHVHLLTSMHPTVTVSNLVKNLKIATHNWIKSEAFFPRLKLGRRAVLHSPAPTVTSIRL